MTYVSWFKDFISHYGVLGMKWGVRNDKKGSGARSSKEIARKASDSSIRASRARALQGRRKLSDSTLEEYIKRLQNEKKFKDLTEADISPAKKFIKDIMTDGTKRALTSIIEGGELYTLRAAMSGKFSVKDLSGYVAQKPKR